MSSNTGSSEVFAAARSAYSITFSYCLEPIIFFATSVFADMGVKPDFWNQTRGYYNYGFVFNFFCNTKYLYIPHKCIKADKSKDTLKQKKQAAFLNEKRVFFTCLFLIF